MDPTDAIIIEVVAAAWWEERTSAPGAPPMEPWEQQDEWVRAGWRQECAAVIRLYLAVVENR